MRCRIRKLLVVSHVVHYLHAGRLYAYGPYTREIDIWADLFPEVIIASPCRSLKPPADCLPFTRPNVAIAAQIETGGQTPMAKLYQILALPWLIWGLCRAMVRADAVHVRCPGNLGLLGAILAPLFARYRVAKYAGQWNGYSGERPVVWLQRNILRSRWWGAPVTVYGNWPGQPSHVHAFFTSMMTQEQVKRAAKVAAGKTVGSPIRVLFCGRLAREKRAEALLSAARMALDQGVELEVTVVGDGPERPSLEQLTSELQLQDSVRFRGALPFEQSLRWYQWADCLILPSRHSEGWPKVVAEAMCHGVLCVAVSHGQIPTMLEGRGILLSAGDASEIAAALKWIGTNQDACHKLMADGFEWARQFSLEGLRQALLELLNDAWQVRLNDGREGQSEEPAMASAPPTQVNQCSQS